MRTSDQLQPRNLVPLHPVQTVDDAVQTVRKHLDRIRLEHSLLQPPRDKIMVQRRHELNLARRSQQAHDGPELLPIRWLHRRRQDGGDLTPGGEELEADGLRGLDGDGVVHELDRLLGDGADLSLEVGGGSLAVEDVRRADGLEVFLVGERGGGDDRAKARDSGELDDCGR
jgi:hypothetical protein